MMKTLFNISSNVKKCREYLTLSSFPHLVKLYACEHLHQATDESHWTTLKTVTTNRKGKSNSYEKIV